MKKRPDVYRSKDCMKKFCKFLREHKTDFTKKKLKILQKSRRNHMKMQNSVIFVERNVKTNV